MAKRLTLYIFIGLVLGLVVGLSLNLSLNDGSAAAAAQLKTIASYFAIVTGLFLRLIKMIIAPLVFATLVSGIAQMGDTKALGRIGVRRSPGSSRPASCRSRWACCWSICSSRRRPEPAAARRHRR